MTEIVSKVYLKLVKELKGILEEGRSKAFEEARRVMLETYWVMGQRICSEGDLEYGEMTQLARDLDLEKTLLTRIVKFYLFWPTKLPAGQQEQLLSWSHYKVLLGVEDKQKRDYYLKHALVNDWTRPQLAAQIKEGFYEQQKKNPLKKKSVAKLEPKDSGYSYAAIVERVVDGDTLLLRVDLGFNVWVNQRIRLRGIDCPELKTPEGKGARDFVVNQLKTCTIVNVHTFKRIDMYGRYICDLFYLPGGGIPRPVFKKENTKKGIFLNQQLLEEGMARVME